MRMVIVLCGLSLSGCATWHKTEINAELGQTFDAWSNPVFAIEATAPVSDRFSVKIGHISDPTTRGPSDPNLTWAGLRVRVK